MEHPNPPSCCPFIVGSEETMHLMLGGY
uniref:Uncharacterized protein n=1 Tax=Anguilla anguilla TaxID=7936 RepID=A0A0E9VH58_ANGAN